MKRYTNTRPSFEDLWRDEDENENTSSSRPSFDELWDNKPSTKSLNTTDKRQTSTQPQSTQSSKATQNTQQPINNTQIFQSPYARNRQQTGTQQGNTAQVGQPQTTQGTQSQTSPFWLKLKESFNSAITLRNDAVKEMNLPDNPTYTDVKNSITQLTEKQSKAKKSGNDTKVYDTALELLQEYSNKTYTLTNNNLSSQERQEIYADKKQELENLESGNDDTTLSRKIDDTNIEEVKKALGSSGNHDMSVDEAADFYVKYRTGAIQYDPDSENHKRYLGLKSLIEAYEGAASQGKIATTKSEIKTYERDHPEDFYSKYRNADDFEELSQKQDIRDSEYSPQNLFGNLSNAFTGYSPKKDEEDKLGAFLQARENESEWAKDNISDDVRHSWLPGFYTDEIIKEGDQNYWKLINDDEKSMYYYLYNKYGKDEAYKYLDRLSTVLGKRNKSNMEAEAAGSDGLDLILRNIDTVPAKLGGSFTSVADDASNLIAGKEINPYSSAHEASQFADVTRAATAEKIDTATNGFNINGFSLGDAYQAGMSAADMVTASALFGGSEAAVGLVMSMDAARSKAQELYEKGATNEQIITESLAAGAFEAVFETVSLDVITNKIIKGMLTKKTAPRYIAAAMMSAGVEGSEEVFTDIANYVTDIIVMKDKSERQQLIQNYLDEGFSKSEAEEKANSDFVQNLYESFMGGAVAGGIFGGTTYGSSAVSSAVENSQERTAIRNTGAKITSAQNVPTLIEQGKASTDESTQKQAGKVEQLYNKQSEKNEKSGKDTSSRKLNKEVGTLMKMVQERNADQINASSEEVEPTVREMVVAATGTENRTAINAIVKSEFLRGESLTEAEQAALDTPVVQKLVQDNQSTFAEMRTNIENAYMKHAETASLVYSDDQEDYDVFDTNDDGRTYIKGTNQVVEPIKVTAIDRDDMDIETTGGETIKASELDYGDKNVAVLLGAMLDIQNKNSNEVQMTPEFVNGAIKLWQDGKYNPESLSSYINDAREVFNAANSNTQYTPETMSQTAADSLYKAAESGKVAAISNKTQQIENAKTGTRHEGSVLFEGSNGTNINIESANDLTKQGIKLNPMQKIGINTVVNMAKSTGIKFRFFQSERNSDGVYMSNYSENGKASPNGFYKNGEIYVDINAGNNGEGLILFTVSHELAHFMRDFAPEQFDTYAKFLFDNYAKRGLSVRQAVHSEMMKHTNLRYDEAYEEVVARLSESFLRDVHLTEKSRELYNTDKTVWEKIRDGLQSIVDRINRWMAGLSPESDLGKIGMKMAKENREILDRFVAGIKAASENAAYIENTTDEGGVRYSSRDIDLVDTTGVAPATEQESLGLDLLDARNLSRYYDDVTSVLENNMPSNRLLLIGKPSEILEKYLGSSNPLYMPQAIVRKVVFDKANGGKHGLGRVVIDDLPYQFTKPLAITGNTSQHQQLGDNSIVVWTDWQTEDGNAIIVPIRVDVNGQVGLYNNVNSVFDAYDQKYVADLLSSENILYTENNRDIHELLNAQGREVPKSQATNVSTDILSHQQAESNPSTQKNQSRDADYLSAVNRGDMETAQRMVDEAAEKAFANSKIRGEDGKLVKVYHGTYADFTVFDKAMGRSSADIQGMFFSPWDIDAGGYGPNVRAFYLNITNPADERTGYKALNAHKGENYAGIKAREDLEKAGYDGVNNSDEEYIAFTSEQIKSADPVTYDDNGNVIPLSERFNSEEKDIRYQERGDQTYTQEEVDEYIRKEREEADKRIKDVLNEYKKKRHESVEKRNKTKVRHSLMKKSHELNKLLNRSAKEKTVKQGLRESTENLLKVSSMLFPESLTVEEMAAEGVGDATAQEQKALDRYNKLLKNRAKKDITQRVRDNINAQLKYLRNNDLKDLITRERKRYEEASREANSLYMKEALTELSDAYKKIKDAKEAYIRDSYDEEFVDMVDAFKEEVGDKLAKDLTLNELLDFNKIVTMMTHSIRNANKMFVAGRKATLAETGDSVMNEILKLRTTKETKVKAVQDLAKFGVDNFKPVYAARYLGSDTFVERFWNLQKGELDFAVDIEEAKNFKEDCEKKRNYKKFKMTKKIEYKDRNGRKFSLNLNQRMALYAMSRRPQGLQHLTGLGFSFESGSKANAVKTYTSATAHPLSVETINKIADSLSANEKGYAEDMQKYLSEVMADKGNQVSLEMYGVKIFNEDIYWRLSSDKNYTPKEEKENKGQYKAKNAGFTHAINRKANNPVELVGFEEAWIDHVYEMSTYHSMVLPLEDITRVFNYRSSVNDESKSVKSTIQGTFSEAMKNYFDTLIADLNGGMVRMDSVAGVDKMISLSKKGAVLANLSVVVQQPSAIFRAMAYVNPKYFAYGGAIVGTAKAAKSLISHVPFIHVESEWENLKKYAPVAIIKEMGGFDTSTGRGVMDYLKSGKNDSWIKRVREGGDKLLGVAPELADRLAWIQLWNAIQRETKAKYGYKVGTEENKIKSGKRFCEVVHLTQVYDSTLSRSGSMRHKDAMSKMLTAYMAEPLTYANMMIDATVQANRVRNSGHFWKAVGHWNKVSASVVTAILVNSFLHAIVLAMRDDKDDDDDGTFPDKYWKAFWGDILDGVNPLNYLPITRDVWSLIDAKIKGYHGTKIERTDMSLIAKGINVIWNATEKAVKGEWTLKDGIDEIGAAASFVGIPITNITRDVRSFLNTYSVIRFGGNNSLKDSTGLNAIAKYQNAYDNAWEKGFSEEDCKKKADQAARAYISKEIKPEYYKALSEENYEKANDLRSFMYRSGVYKDKYGRPSLSTVDDLIEDWKDEAKEKAKQIGSATQRRWSK